MIKPLRRPAAALLIALSSLAPSAHAQLIDMRSFAGWAAWKQPDGVIKISRTDLPAPTSIHVYPTDETPVTTPGEVVARAKEIQIRIADRYARCAALRTKEAKPNGMGLEVMDPEDGTRCYLFIGATKEGKLFANVQVSDGEMERESLPFQQMAGLFLGLAVDRIEGRDFLLGEGAVVDLEQFAKWFSDDNLPARMVAAFSPGHRYASDRYQAIALLKNHTASSCSDWDPLFFTPKDLTPARGGATDAFGAPRCRLLAWRADPDSASIAIHDGTGWKPAAEALGRQVIDVNVKPFAKAEKLNLLAGSKERLFAVVQGKADIRTLRPGDAWFTPDGQFLAADLGLANRPLHMPRQLSGRYHVEGHVIVLDLDNGPVLIGLAGKTEGGGKLTGLFVGSAAYGDFH